MCSCLKREEWLGLSYEESDAEALVQGVADRVILGLLPSSQCAWGTALGALGDRGGCLHLHGNVRDSDEAAWSQATLVRVTPSIS